MTVALKRAGRALARLYPMGFSLLWKAPLVLALVVVPEFLQHIAEIQLGMFGTRAQAAAVADHPTRMAFGALKIAGLVLTFFAAARFWWVRAHGGRWWDVRAIAWGRFLLGLLLFMGVPVLPDLFKAQLDTQALPAAGLGPCSGHAADAVPAARRPVRRPHDRDIGDVATGVAVAVADRFAGGARLRARAMAPRHEPQMGVRRASGDRLDTDDLQLAGRRPARRPYRNRALPRLCRLCRAASEGRQTVQPITAGHLAIH